MPSENTTDNSDTTEEASHLRPVTSSGDKLSWADSNDARLEGLLFWTKKFWKRNHLFVEFFKHHAVSVGSKLAVDSPNATLFITGVFADPRDADDRCPPTARRVAELATRSPGTKFAPLTAGTALPSHIIVAPHFIDKEDGRLLKSLSYLIEGSIHANKLIDKADGSGEALLLALEDRASKAKAKGKAVVAAEFARHVSDGVKGELTLPSLDLFIRTYQKLKINISRPISDEEELEMMNTVAFKSPEVREIYELKTTVAPPTDLESALEILEEILHARILSDDIDRISSGTGSALAATNATPVGDETAARITELEALVSELRDPSKTAKPTQFVKAPRDADNNIIRWIPGMQPCRCKKKQPGDSEPGGHLVRDCTTNAPPAGKRGKPPTKPGPPAGPKAEEQAAAPKTGLVVEIVEGMSDDEINAKLNAMFGLECAGSEE